MTVITIGPHVLDSRKEEILEAKALASTVVEANTLPNQETKVTVAVPAAAVAMAVAVGCHDCQETKLSRRARDVRAKIQVTTGL